MGEDIVPGNNVDFASGGAQPGHMVSNLAGMLQQFYR